MAKLYFKYGAMGSCKSVQALTTDFNYRERGMNTWLIKPCTDTRDGKDIIRSRIGLESKCDTIELDDNIYDRFNEKQRGKNKPKIDVIICDECQFLTQKQIDQLRYIVDFCHIPVLCFGLRTDFNLKLFPGSERLFEVADSFSEIKTMCACGSKATVNARIDENGNLITEGDQIDIGGNDKYISVCHRCYYTMKYL